MTRDPDIHLVRRVGKGNGAAYRELVDRHLPKVSALAWRMLRDRAEAEDVCQETFLRVWKHAGSWKPGKALFSTWLHKVAVHLCLDRLRKHRETDMEGVAEPGSGEPTPEGRMHRRDVARRVARALDGLPKRQKAAIVLCHYQELTNIEAAEAMEISVEAVESLLARGRRKLRQELRHEAEELMREGPQ